MSVHSEYTRLVNKYLDGDMSASERDIFEEQLTLDPMLKSEFEHQNEIIHGLKEYRKSQLKARLDNVSVTPGILGVLSQGATIKNASFIATSILVGSGVYYYFSKEEVRTLELIELSPKLEFMDNRIELTDSQQSPNYRYNKSTEPSTWIEVDGDKDKLATETYQPNKIDFEVPEMEEEVSSDFVSEPEQILEKVMRNNSGFADVAEIEKVDIENIVTNRYKFHYKLVSNKLFLYGKFEASPYEIIEINSYQNKRLFFFYNGHYYRLKKDIQEISPLVKIEDQALINELNIIKHKE